MIGKSFECLRLGEAVEEAVALEPYASLLPSYMMYREWLIATAAPLSLALGAPARTLRLGRNTGLFAPLITEGALAANPPLLRAPNGPSGSASKFLFVRHRGPFVLGASYGDAVSVYECESSLPSTVLNMALRVPTQPSDVWLHPSDRQRVLHCRASSTPSSKCLLRLVMKQPKGANENPQILQGYLEVIPEPRVVNVMTALRTDCTDRPAPRRPMVHFGSSAHLSLLARAVLVWLVQRTPPGSQEVVVVSSSLLVAAFPSLGFLRRSALVDLMRAVTQLLVDPSGSVEIEFCAPDAITSEPCLTCRVRSCGALMLHSLLRETSLADLHACEAPVLQLRGLLSIRGGALGTLFRYLRRALDTPQLVVAARPAASALVKLFAAFRWGEQTAESLSAQLVAEFGLTLLGNSAVADETLRSTFSAIAHPRKGFDVAAAARVLLAAVVERVTDLSMMEPTKEMPSGGSCRGTGHLGGLHSAASPLAAAAAAAAPALPEFGASDGLLDDLFGSDTDPQSGRSSAAAGGLDEGFDDRIPRKLTIFTNSTGAVEVVTDAQRIKLLWGSMRRQARQGGVPKCTRCNGPAHTSAHCFLSLREFVGSRAFSANISSAVGISEAATAARAAEPVAAKAAEPAAAKVAGSVEDQERQSLFAVNLRARQRRVPPLSDVWKEILEAAKGKQEFSNKSLPPLKANWENALCHLCSTEEEFLRHVAVLFPNGDPRQIAVAQEVLLRKSDVESSAEVEKLRQLKRRRDEQVLQPASQRRPAALPRVDAEDQDPPPADVASLLTVRVRRAAWLCQYCKQQQDGEQLVHYEECPGLTGST
jgi:hypothetical protein